MTAAVPVVQDGVVTWQGTLEASGLSPVAVTFTFPQTEAGPPTSLRPFLLAFLLPAMRIGAPLVVDGPVDAGTITALMEWQEAMASWHRSDLTVVPIRAEARSAAGDPPLSAPSDRALMAFSGGLDSCFSAVRHRPAARADADTAAYRRTTVSAGLMVHGFDIPLDDPQAFHAAFDRSATMLRALDIEPLWVRTDVRSLEERFGLSWETAGHGIWLVAALACFEHPFDRLVVPSTFAYDQQQLPWGSNPLTDPLLGSDTVSVWHDGAAHDRLAKARAVATSEAVRRGLRVCWEGERHDRNCGHCYKCLTTQACFWLAGVEDLPCFDHPGSPADLASVAFRSPFQLRLAHDLHAEAQRVGRADVADAIDAALSSG